jgi:hypothetical protein
MAVTTHPDGSRTSPNWDQDEAVPGDEDKYPPIGLSPKEKKAWFERKKKGKSKSKSKGGIVFRGGGIVKRPKRTKLY